MTIKKVTKDDSSAIAEIEKKSFDEPWSEALIAEELSREDSASFAVLSENILAAYASFRINYDEAEVFRVAVIPAYRQRGFAGQLLRTGEEYCREQGKTVMILEVDEINESAIALYKKTGYVEYHRRKNYYGTRAALCMKKMLE